MVLQKYIDDKLLEFTQTPLKLDTKLTTPLHKLVVESLALNQLDIRTSFHTLAKGKDLTREPDILNAVKDVSMLQIDYMKDYDAFNSKTLKVKPQLIDFLAKYLIKRRATYLYIYMLLQQKNIELLKILKLLGDKFYEIQDMVIPPGGISPVVFDIKDILINLNIQLQNKIQPINPKLANEIANIFNNTLMQAQSHQNIDYIQAFASLGELISLLNGKTEGYKALVTDVIPLMAEWNDTSNKSM